MNGKKSRGQQSPGPALEGTGARAARDDADGAHALVTLTDLLTLMMIPPPGTAVRALAAAPSHQPRLLLSSIAKLSSTASCDLYHLHHFGRLLRV